MPQTSQPSYRGDHAVVLFPGSTAAKEGDEENHHADGDEDDRSSGGCGVVDHQRFVQSHLDQDPHHDQRQAAQLQGRRVTALEGVSTVFTFSHRRFYPKWEKTLVKETFERVELLRPGL